MEITQKRYKSMDRLLSEIIDGLAAVAFLGACIFLLVSFWGILNHDPVLAEKRVEFLQTTASFSPVP